MANMTFFGSLSRLFDGACCCNATKRCIKRTIPLTWIDKKHKSSGSIFNGELSAHELEIKSTEKQGQPVDQLHQATSEILYLNASGSDNRSFSTLAFRAFYSSYTSIHPEDKVTELNLWQSDIVRYNLSHVQSKIRMLKGKGTHEDKENFMPIKRMIDQLITCDKLVLSTPMWNFTVPYILKQYIDVVVQPGVTFKETPNGPVGLISGKPMLLITSCGGDYSRAPMDKFDFLVPYLKCIFGLIGFTDIRHINIGNTANSTREKVLDEISRLAKKQAETF